MRPIVAREELQGKIFFKEFRFRTKMESRYHKKERKSGL